MPVRASGDAEHCTQLSSDDIPTSCRHATQVRYDIHFSWVFGLSRRGLGSSVETPSEIFSRTPATRLRSDRAEPLGTGADTHTKPSRQARAHLSGTFGMNITSMCHSVQRTLIRRKTHSGEELLQIVSLLLRIYWGRHTSR